VTIILSWVDLGSDNLFGIFLWPLYCLCVDVGSEKIPKRLSEPKSTHRQYNGHKKIPKRLSEPKSTQDNTMVTRRYQRDY
jgi:hypothetical protein